MPGQFPDEALYDLDAWDEAFWVKRALLKRTTRELSLLQLPRLAYWGDKEYKQRENQLINRIRLFSPSSKEEDEKTYAASWTFIRRKGRG